MGFFKELKQISARREKRKQERKNSVNENPTEEEMKNNKKGKLSYLMTFVSIVVYVIGFGLVAKGFEENVAIGILALLLVLVITPIAHTKAINLAKEQRKINGKGKFALILAIILPSACLAFGFFFFVFGGYYLVLAK